MLKKHMRPLGRKGQTVKHSGKGATEEVLPSRQALSTLTQGDPAQRTFQNYAKASPMMPSDADSPDIQGM